MWQPKFVYNVTLAISAVVCVDDANLKKTTPVEGTRAMLTSRWALRTRHGCSSRQTKSMGVFCVVNVLMNLGRISDLTLKTTHLTLVMNNIHTSSLSHLSNMLSSLLVNSRSAERAKKRKLEWPGPAPTSWPAPPSSQWGAIQTRMTMTATARSAPSAPVITPCPSPNRAPRRPA